MKINYIKSIIKALITVLISVFVYYLFYIEFVRENVEDFAFDIINEYYLSSKEDRSNSPKVMLFKVDEYYLKQNDLLNDDNETTYGYLFPRNHIASFINKIDNLTKATNGACPKALFIDYDFTYPGSYNLELTPNDQVLLTSLKKERCYTIILPKNQNQNFIENSTDKTIKNLITNKKILFASVGLTEAGDRISRRYYPYEYFTNNKNTKQAYVGASIALWNLPERYTSEELQKMFHQEKISLIENRIIFKDNVMYEKTDTYETLQSMWNNLTIYSANYTVEDIPKENFDGVILLYGSSHHANNDYFIMDVFDSEISGVEMHANALMTLFYLDGNLQRLNVYLTALFVFIIIIFSDIITQLVGKYWELIERRKEYAYIFVALFIMLCLSIYLLIVYKIWFNWFIPSLLTMIIPISISVFKITTNPSIKNLLLYLIMAKFISKFKEATIKKFKKVK